MTIIRLETFIRADIGICFDLARDIGVHLKSMTHTGERVIKGRASGLCEAGDTVTWEARHLGIRQQLTVEITKVRYPHFFEDRMVRGAFKSMRHEHHFAEVDGGTIMSDLFCYEVPLGLLGKIFDKVVLRRYMCRLLEKRNQLIKQQAEHKA